MFAIKKVDDANTPVPITMANHDVENFSIVFLNPCTLPNQDFNIKNL